MLNRKLQYVFVKSELGAGTYGASLGIEAVQLAASKRESLIFEKHPTTWIEDESVDQDLPPFAHNIKTVVELTQQIAAEVMKVKRAGRFPLVLSGDHSIAMGTIAGIKMAQPKKRLGVIWIDAHGDIHTPFTTPSGNMHGMPLAASLDLAETEDSINQPDGETVKCWEELCRLGRIHPKLAFTDLVYIGVRDLEEPEWRLLHKHNIRYFQPEKVRELGVAETVKQTLEHLHACDELYISFDVDCMDISVVYGTGTPTANGFTVAQAKELINLLWQQPKLAAFEVAEVNPLLDANNRTAEIVVDIIESFMKPE